MIFLSETACMRTLRPLTFSRSPIPTHHTSSQSHFGTNASPIPEKLPSFFSNTYGNPFCNPLCFQIHAGMGGGYPRNGLTFSLSSTESSPPHDGKCAPPRPEERRVTPLSATLTNIPASVANKGFIGRLSLLDATLTKNRGRGPFRLSSELATRHSPLYFLLVHGALGVDGGADDSDLVGGRDQFKPAALQRAHLHHFMQIPV